VVRHARVAAVIFVAGASRVPGGRTACAPADAVAVDRRAGVGQTRCVSNAHGLRVLAATALLAVAALAAGDEDHPLVTRYPGSTLTARDAKDFAAYALVVGLDPKTMAFETRPLEGRVTRIAYANPADRSTLEIFRNYREALDRAGAETLFTCEENACGPAYARTAWSKQHGLYVASDGDPRYLAARVAAGEAEAFVAVMVGKRRTQVDVVEAKAMDRGLVAVDVGALAEGIEREGSVRVYGIHFDHDKADIRPDSKPTLDAIAELLKTKPALSLFVVGHTDGTGTLAHNLELSRARGRAVVAALVGQYGIAAARLDGHGVGPLAPVAPNTTAAGRAKNRRVELVAR
jgi:outer membrane protein OmpA-like peptidoglycan-associated protein